MQKPEILSDEWLFDRLEVLQPCLRVYFRKFNMMCGPENDLFDVFTCKKCNFPISGAGNTICNALSRLYTVLCY